MSERKPTKTHHVHVPHHDRWVTIRNVLFHNKWIKQDDFPSSLEWMLDLAERALWKDKELQRQIVRKRAEERASENADVAGDGQGTDGNGDTQVSDGVSGGQGGTEEDCS